MKNELEKLRKKAFKSTSIIALDQNIVIAEKMMQIKELMNFIKQDLMNHEARVNEEEQKLANCISPCVPDENLYDFYNKRRFSSEIYELADLLGYEIDDEDEMFGLSTDDIWERTGH